MKCKHLVVCEEAYCVETGEALPGFLCIWSVGRGVRPTWVENRIGGGMLIDPKIECSNCPCFEKQQANAA